MGIRSRRHGTSKHHRLRCRRRISHLGLLRPLLLHYRHARFTGKTNLTAGSISYNEKTRVVTWALNKLPAAAPPVNIDFEVGITPTDDMVGASPHLTTQTSFEAEDSAVGTTLRQEIPDGTTSLQDDPFAKGKGIVQK